VSAAAKQRSDRGDILGVNVSAITMVDAIAPDDLGLGPDIHRCFIFLGGLVRTTTLRSA
jgi:hypothetical protein